MVFSMVHWRTRCQKNPSRYWLAKYELYVYVRVHYDWNLTLLLEVTETLAILSEHKKCWKGAVCTRHVIPDGVIRGHRVTITRRCRLDQGNTQTKCDYCTCILNGWKVKVLLWFVHKRTDKPKHQKQCRHIIWSGRHHGQSSLSL